VVTLAWSLDRSVGDLFSEEFLGNEDIVKRVCETSPRLKALARSHAIIRGIAQADRLEAVQPCLVEGPAGPAPFPG
jgi:hypothetical protein